MEKKDTPVSLTRGALLLASSSWNKGSLARAHESVKREGRGAYAAGRTVARGAVARTRVFYLYPLVD
jgi:hypothetical protein